jgi:UV DNA damage endonuclease
MNLGYCCINLTLGEKGITTNRGMIKRTFQAEGKQRASDLALLNLQDVLQVLHWNLEQGILIYRMSSDLFPWMSEYKFEDLPNYPQIQQACEEIGSFALANNIRLSFHPGQFDVLASERESVVDKTIYDLDQHARIMDMMRLPKTHQFPLNIHVGGTYGDKESAAYRFCQNFSRLSESTRSRLVVENDDKETQYSVVDLHQLIFSRVGTPITFDFFHHLFCTGDLTSDQAASLAASTWPVGIRPLAHYSSSRKINEDQSSKSPRSHADFIYEEIPEIGRFFDIEIEAKAKELALFRYQEQFNQIENESNKI